MEPTHATPQSAASEAQIAIKSPYAGLLASCRRQERLSRAELAERMGVLEQTVALWEDPGYEGVDLTVMQRVAKATGRTLEVRFALPARAARPDADRAQPELLHKATA